MDTKPKKEKKVYSKSGSCKWSRLGEGMRKPLRGGGTLHLGVLQTSKKKFRPKGVPTWRAAKRFVLPRAESDGRN